MMGKLRCFLFRALDLRGAGSGGLLPVLRKTEGGRGKSRFQTRTPTTEEGEGEGERETSEVKVRSCRKSPPPPPVFSEPKECLHVCIEMGGNY